MDTAKTFALFVHLALDRRSHRRDSLVNMLWPDSDGRQGRGLLRHALYVLRKTITAECIEADRDTVSLRPDFDLWIEALASRPDGDFAQKVYPTLDHTFAYGLPIDDLHESCLCGDNSLPRQVDRAVIDDIAQFIKER